MMRPGILADLECEEGMAAGSREETGREGGELAAKTTCCGQAWLDRRVPTISATVSIRSASRRLASSSRRFSAVEGA